MPLPRLPQIKHRQHQAERSPLGARPHLMRVSSSYFCRTMQRFSDAMMSYRSVSHTAAPRSCLAASAVRPATCSLLFSPPPIPLIGLSLTLHNRIKDDLATQTYDITAIIMPDLDTTRHSRRRNTPSSQLISPLSLFNIPLISTSPDLAQQQPRPHPKTDHGRRLWVSRTVTHPSPSPPHQSPPRTHHQQLSAASNTSA